MTAASETGAVVTFTVEEKPFYVPVSAIENQVKQMMGIA